MVRKNIMESSTFYSVSKASQWCPYFRSFWRIFHGIHCIPEDLVFTPSHFTWQWLTSIMYNSSVEGGNQFSLSFCSDYLLLGPVPPWTPVGFSIPIFLNLITWNYEVIYYLINVSIPFPSSTWRDTVCSSTIPTSLLYCSTPPNNPLLQEVPPWLTPYPSPAF